MGKWLACKYKDGEIKVKPYRNEGQMEKILDSGFVKSIIGPYEANTFDEVNEIATKNFATASISNRMVFKKIREMIASGKTDKEIVDMLKAESKEELIEEAAIEAAKTYGKELRKQIRVRMNADMEEIKEQFEVDTAITPVYDLYFKTLKEELGDFV